MPNLHSGMLRGQYWPGGTFPAGSARLDWATQTIRDAISRHGCLMWLDAHDVVGIADGADVTTWPARVGADPTQPSAGLRPNYDASGPYVNFGGAGSIESMPTVIDLTGTAQLTVVIACHTRDAVGSPRVWEHGNPYYDFNGASVAFSGGLATVATGAGSAASITYRTANTGLSGLNVMATAFDRATNPDSIRLHLQSGVVTSFSASGDGDAAGNYGANVSQLGSRGNGTSLPIDGGVACAIWIPAFMSADETQLLVYAMEICARS